MSQRDGDPKQPTVCHALVDQAPLAVIVVSPDGLIAEWNDAAEALYGLSRDEVLGTPVWEVHRRVSVPEMDIEPRLPALERETRNVLASGQPASGAEGVFQIMRPDGSRVHIEQQVFPLHHPSGTHLGAVARDMTLRVAASTVLDRDHLLDVLVKHSNDQLILLDREGRYTFVSGKVRGTLGYDPSELIGLRVLDLVHPDDLEATAAALDEVMSFMGATCRAEYRYRHKDGRWVPLETIGSNLLHDPRVQAVVLNTRDISERVRAEQALRASEEQFRAIATSANAVVYVLDQDGRFLLSEGRALTDLGLGPGEVVGRSVFDVYRDTPEILSHVSEALAGRPVRELIELDGIAFDASATPYRTERTDSLRVVGLAHDITRYKRAEEQKLQLEEQLAQTSKMEAIGRLAGGVAHDFNNLLTGIGGYADILLAGLEPSDPRHGDVLEIRKATERASALTTQLLAFSRKQTISPKIVEPNELLAGATRLIQRIIGEDIDLVFVPGADLGKVKVDPNQMEQVLVNLAVNARDAMPDGGLLTVETVQVQVDEDYARLQPDARPGSYAVIAVSDDGTGIPPAVQEHLFEPFYTTKPRGEGTGLGLATVYGIVHQNDGFIHVYSEVDEGTTFKIYLPLASEPAEPVEPVRSGPVPAGTESVLVVEDEAMVRALARRILEKRGYEVLTAADAEEALEVASDPELELDLLLSDVVLPGLNGPELYDRILQSRPDLRVLFISGYMENAMWRQGILDRGTTFLRKPFAVEDLARKVREVLDGDE